MGDKRRHRGKHPQDEQLFAAAQLPALRTAVRELSWLLERGYNERSATKLVGDRHALSARQRDALGRCSCGDTALAQRLDKRVVLSELAGAAVALDGFNVLITLESAFSGAVVLQGRDRAHRDLASLHGTYRSVEETGVALQHCGRVLAAAGVAHCHWVLDQPVSNSGRLRAKMRDLAAEAGWDWEIELSKSADRRLYEQSLPVATADSLIMDQGPGWLDLPGAVIASTQTEAWLIDLAPDQGS